LKPAARAAATRAGGKAAPAAARAMGEVPPAGVSLSHPAMLTGALLTAIAIAFGVTFVLYDADLWQHLAVGRAIWRLHGVPSTQLWIWPLYGAPALCPSWLFRALLWPFWAAGEVLGVYVWRWITALAAFGLLWAAARRMGARGFSALFVMALAALSFRHRSQLRPDTLVAVLLALEIWILARWRADGRERRIAVALVLWAWVNAHISWPLGFCVLGAFALDAEWRSRRGLGRPAAALLPYLAAALAGGALGFVNPSGWRVIVEPFEFVFSGRATPLYHNIAELQPLMWGVHWKTGIALLLLGWPAMIVARIARRVDLAELLTCVLFTMLALTSQRFIGLYALIAAPFVARDVAEWLAWRAARPGAGGGSAAEPGAAPGSASRAWRGCALLALATLGVSALEWTRPDVPLGLGIDWREYPVGACDFIAGHGLEGPLFNEYYYGGYILWRFWPDRARLPFMDIHQSGTAEDRALYPFVFRSDDAWRALDARHPFQLLLVDGSLRHVPGNRLPDILDADSTWTLIFRDDQACLYARRGGVNESAAASEGYRLVPGGSARLAALGAACDRDPVLRAEARAELERQAAASRWNSRASSLLANIALIEGRDDDARTLMRHALAVEPTLPSGHERLGMIALGAGDARSALTEFEWEERAGTGSVELGLRVAEARRALGDRAGARAAYRSYLARHPGDARAQAELDALGARDSSRSH
jgi:hypothetical protein